jgi:hypothetical protein
MLARIVKYGARRIIPPTYTQNYFVPMRGYFWYPAVGISEEGVLSL